MKKTMMFAGAVAVGPQEPPSDPERPWRAIMLKSKYIVLPFAALLASCSNEQDAAPRTSAATGEAVISTAADCTAGFAPAREGLKVVLDGRTASGERERYGYQYSVKARNGSELRVQETMLVGDPRRPGPEDIDVRRDGFVLLADGTDRQFAYEGLPAGAIQAMKPGDELVAPMVERSDFGPKAGKGEVRGAYRVRFEGCGSVDVGGVSEPAKVFHVQSVGRSYDARAAGGPTDTTREVWNRYWMSERLGLELRRDMPSGSMVAIAIEEPA